jgi:hypothetical protein
MSRILATFLSLFIVVSLVSAADFSVKETPGEHVDVVYKGRTLTRFMTARDDSTPERTHETYKTYMHVIDPLDPDGKRYITKGAGGKFTHHRGIYIGFSRMKAGPHGGDWWHCKKDERQAYTKIISQDAGDDKIVLTVGVEWRKGDVVCVSEERQFTVHKPDAKGSFLIEKVAKLTAVVGDVELKGDPEHAGCQFRPDNEVASNKSAKYLAPGKAAVGNKGVKDLPWVAESYKLGDRNYLIQHMCDPGLPKGTVYSAYRDYGRFGAYFVDKIPKGETKSYRFGFYISTGTLPDSEDEMQARWKAFAGK